MGSRKLVEVFCNPKYSIKGKTMLSLTCQKENRPLRGQDAGPVRAAACWGQGCVYMGKYLPIILAARYGSLNKAASLLGYAQPSMMYIINKTEDDLGVKLFYRTKRGVTLTEAGEKLLPVMVQMETQEDSIHNMARSFQENRLRIGTFPGMPGRWLSALLAAVTGENPEVLIRLETVSSLREGLEGVEHSTLHCCFSLLTEAPGASCLRLREDPYVLVLAADHPLAGEKEASLAEVLAQLPLIPSPESYDPDSPLWAVYQNPRQVFLPDSTPPDPVFSMALAEKGLGAALLPALLLEELPLRDTLRVLPLTDGPVRTLTLLAPPKATRSAMVSGFVGLAERFVQETEESNLRLY